MPNYQHPPSVRKIALAGTVTSLASLALIAPSVAQSQTVDATGQGRILLLTKTANKFAAAGIKVTPSGSAKSQDRQQFFDLSAITSSDDYAWMHAAPDQGLIFTRGSKSVQINKIRFRAGKTPHVSGFIGDKKLYLYKAISKPEVAVGADAVSMKSGVYGLSATAARALRRKLSVSRNSLPAGQKVVIEASAAKLPKPVQPPVVTTTTTTPTTTTTTPVKTCGGATTPLSKIGKAEWSLRASWANYITGGTPAGSIEAADGATQSSSGNIYKWDYEAVKVSCDLTNNSRTIETRGVVKFLKAAHGIAMHIANPKFVLPLDGSTGYVEADVTKSGSTTEDLRLLELGPVSASVTSGSQVWADVPATVTGANSTAATLLNYAAGTSYGSFSLTLPSDYLTVK